MKLIFCTCVALVTVASPAEAYFCSEPSAPYCVSRYGPFNDGYDFERCKREVQQYASDTEEYLRCLNRESEAAVSAYNEAVESFNRRARAY